MVGSSLKPSCGRHVTPIHSIPYSVAHLWREVYKYYSYIIRGHVWQDTADYSLDLMPGYVGAVNFRKTKGLALHIFND